MRWHIGTSGYSYAAWKGKFYPPRLPSRAMLGYYASRLDTVEINSSFYRIPAAAALAAWAAQVPSDFCFALKAPRRITHEHRLHDAARPTHQLLTAVAALGRHRGPLLFQLPPDLAIDRERLYAFLAVLPPQLPAAFEFRHPSWHEASVYRALREHGFALCTAETDDAAHPLVAPAEWGYLRLRRSRYSDDDLRHWSARAGAQSWRDVYVYFKHDDAARGPAFARRLREIVERR
jgi:uncharacterized protein YecE (DUF72 family)